jgi:CelD/BcsL family acetyltransferase involved in cellulose biosynthesis
VTASSRYVVRDEELESLSSEWEALLSDRDSVFLHPAWLTTWRAAFPDDRPLRTMAVREDGTLIGVAAFVVEDDRFVLAGDPNVWDYAGIPSRAGCEAEVLRSVLEQLSSEGAREVVLWGIDERAPLVEVLPATAEACGYSAEREQEAVCPAVALPEGWDAYLGSLSKKDRHELRRKLRRFEEADGGTRLIELTEATDVVAALPDFTRLHIESRADKAEFMTERMQHYFGALAEEFARQGRLSLYFLERSGQRIASLLCFQAGDELMLYNSGYDPAFANISVGIVSKALCLQKAIADGKRSFNFLRGEERYKYDLGAVDRAVYRYRLTPA